MLPIDEESNCLGFPPYSMHNTSPRSSASLWHPNGSDALPQLSYIHGLTLIRQDNDVECGPDWLLSWLSHSGDLKPLGPHHRRRNKLDNVIFAYKIVAYKSKDKSIKMFYKSQILFWDKSSINPYSITSP